MGKPQSLHDAADKIMAILNAETGAAKRDDGAMGKVGTAPGGGIPRRLAQELNIPIRLSEAGGKYAWAAMLELKQGLDAGGGGLRMDHVAKGR